MKTMNKAMRTMAVLASISAVALVSPAMGAGQRADEEAMSGTTKTDTGTYGSGKGASEGSTAPADSGASARSPAMDADVTNGPASKTYDSRTQPAEDMSGRSARESQSGVGVEDEMLEPGMDDSAKQPATGRDSDMTEPMEE